jgi:hypothetical protein
MLDGLAGFTISIMESHTVFMKYLKLFELQRKLGRFSRNDHTEKKAP